MKCEEIKSGGTVGTMVDVAPPQKFTRGGKTLFSSPPPRFELDQNNNCNISYRAQELSAFSVLPD